MINHLSATHCVVANSSAHSTYYSVRLASRFVSALHCARIQIIYKEDRK